MEKEFDNTLTVKIENGGMITIQVLDIIDENPFNKSFIIYNVPGNDSIFSSILNEGETEYSLDTIEDTKELEYINALIDKAIEESE